MNKEHTIRIAPADIAMAWGKKLEKGEDAPAPMMFSNMEKFGFSKDEADSIRSWAELFPIARKFKSESMRRADEAEEELNRIGEYGDPEKITDLEITIFRERVEHDYSTVWLLDKKRGGYNCVLINGSLDECKKWVADNHLEELTDITHDPDFCQWQLDYEIEHREENIENRKKWLESQKIENNKEL